MKKIALLLAMVMLLVCVLASCGGNTEESKETSKEVSAATSTDASKAPEESQPAEESEEPAGPAYAEGTVEIDRSLTATSVTAGRGLVNELVSTRDEADKWGKLTCEAEDGTVKHKFTDGVKSNDGGDTSAFFGTAGAPIEIIIDLGEKVDGLADFSVWSAINTSWAISIIDSVQFFVSDDGENYLPIADPVLGSGLEAVETNGDWTIYEFKEELEMGVSGQYVKFAINKIDHKWIGEVNVDVYK